MKLELDLTAGDWTDYTQAPIADLKRVGVLIPVEPVGIRQFVRLGAVADGKPVVVVTPWQIWAAAHRALADRLGEPAPEPAAAEPLGVLVDVQGAMRQHEHRWGLGPEHEDGTDREAWQEDVDYSHDAATKAALAGEITWAHTLLEAVYGALATEDAGELRQALALVAATAANWMGAIDGRTDA
ncbi:hypothetical protein [Nonomuraea sp. NPDC049750]|uniref:hypothetical protein n=1 Tax=Nonomuraea sp. NPDC049750 TaxID=3154738 RepID=UPI0033D1DC5A